jgi:hypothetical protein
MSKTVWTAALVLLALGCLEYLAILADVGFDLSQSPWVLLVVLAVPFAVVLGLLPRRPRAGLVLMVLMRPGPCRAGGEHPPGWVRQAGMGRLSVRLCWRAGGRRGPGRRGT